MSHQPERALTHQKIIQGCTGMLYVEMSHQPERALTLIIEIWVRLEMPPGRNESSAREGIDTLLDTV